MTTYGAIEVRAVGEIRFLTIHRPERRNALRPRDVAAFIEALHDIERDASAACIVVGGEGGWLCAGGDLAADTATSPRDSEIQLGDYQRLLLGLVRCRVPIVTVLEGAAVGAGVALALAADICVATPTSRLLVPWLVRGLVPDMGVAFMLSRRVGPSRAKAALLSGEPISAERACEWGLITVVADDAWREARSWAQRIAAGPPMATALTMRLVNQSCFADLESYLNAERSSMLAVFGTGEPAEGIAAFIARRAPQFGAARSEPESEDAPLRQLDD